MRILIAEDDLTSRRMLAAVLKKNGYDVLETADGAEAWQVLQEPDAPAMIILDWMMPNMDGPEVVRRVRSMETDRPPYIMMLTTKGQTADIIAGLDAGANDYLTKPFDVGELRSRIGVGMRMLDIQEQLAAKVKDLSEALGHIKTLQGILPICSYCKKICNDQGCWDKLESYISRHSDAKFSHGVCPECIREHYPDIAEEFAEELKLNQKKEKE